MKKILFLLILALVTQLTFAQTLPSYVSTNGLVGYWPFNGNANDESGHGNNGIVTGALLSSDRALNANSCYNFNVNNWSWGSGGDEIYIPFNSSFNSSSISVSTWFMKTSDGTQGQGLTIINRFQYGYSNPDGETFLLRMEPSNQYALEADILSAGTNINDQTGIANLGPSIQLNTWTHAVFTFDGFILKLYINGVLISSNSLSGFSLNTNGNSGISIGVSDQANGHWGPFDGKIDDIGIWNRALTQEEITQLYTAPAQTPNPTASAQTFCAPTTVASLVATGTDLKWYTAATGGTALSSNVVLSSGTFYVSQTLNTIESDRTAVVVTVNEAQITASATTVCSGTAVNMTISSSSSPSLSNGIINYSRTVGIELYVSPNGIDTPTNGTTNSPFKTIQYAINSAQNNQIITLKNGIYNGVGNRNINLLGKKLIIQSENGPESSIMDCEQSERGFNINQGETNETIIQGLTIKNGKTFSSPIGYGSAIFVEDNSSISIKNCLFESNLESTLQFGDTEVAGGQSFVSNCVFRNNLHSQVNSSKKTVTVESCLFENNISLPGEICGNGHASYPPSYYKNCIFRNNQADIIVGLGHAKSLVNCLLYNNTTTYGTVYMGTCWSGINVVNHCTFYNNTCNYYDSHWYDHIGQVYNSIFSGPNSTARNHVSGNQGAISYFSCREGDPSFIDATNGNFNLAPSSNCIANANDGQNIGVDFLQLPNFNNNSSYLWSTGETTATINPTPTATTTYWCDVTANGVTCRKEMSITVRPLAPTAAAQTFCGATTVSSLAATGTELKWYAAATGGTTLASNVALASGTYYVSQTLNTIESDRTAVAVTVNNALITASANTVSSGTAVALTLNNFNATSVIIDEFTMPFSGPFNRIVNTTIGQVYSMIVSGKWDSHCDYPGGKIDASFWGIHTSIQSPSDFIKWNGVFIRPTQDLYQPSHIYSYSNLISNSNTQTFAFTDNPYGDNCGALNFTVLSNQSNCIWSTGETTATINPTPTATTTYWCDVTANGITCRKEMTITVGSLGTEVFDKSSLSLYPNPTSSVLNVKVDANIAHKPYNITDALGKIILKGKLNEGDTTINVEHLSKGIYYIKIANNKASKFIKE